MFSHDVAHCLLDASVVILFSTRLGQVMGTDRILGCNMTSFPRARIDWFKNGRRIEHSYKHRVEFYPGGYDTVNLTLLIYYVNVHDYGDYRCEARNRMGSDRATMVLYGKLSYYLICSSTLSD